MTFKKLKPFLACLLLIVAGTPAMADNRPYRLVCFEQSGLIKSLDGVVNAQQFLRNDSTLRNGSCAFAQVPSGSTARYLGIHRGNGTGFLFPLYRVTYATTGQRMFSADGIFRADQWKVSRIRGTTQEILQPRRCDALDGFVSATGRVPKYIYIPPICDIEIVE